MSPLKNVLFVITKSVNNVDVEVARGYSADDGSLSVSLVPGHYKVTISAPTGYTAETLSSKNPGEDFVESASSTIVEIDVVEDNVALVNSVSVEN